MTEVNNPIIEFHRQRGYEIEHSIDDYLVLKHPNGDTKLYNPNTRVVTGGANLSAPRSRCEDFSDDLGTAGE